MCLTGAAAGALAGMGMGGGAVLIPALTLIFGVGQRGAQGVNMIAFLPAAALALSVHRREGRLRTKDNLPMIILGVIGAVAGAYIASLMEDGWLRRGFGWLLIGMSIVRLVRANAGKKQ